MGGNPGVILRYRFDESTVARLLAMRWWEWEPAKVARNVRALCGGDVGALEMA